MKYFKYFLCYLLILMNGGHMLHFYKQPMAAGIFIASIIFFVFGIFKFYKNDLVNISIIIILLLLLMVYTNLSFQLTAFLYIIFVIIFAYALICIVGFEFKERFIEVVIFLSVASLIFYFGQITGVNNIFLRYVPKYWGNDIFGDTRGGLIYVFNNSIHFTRNCGIYNEPGMYQIILNLALYFILFMKTNFAEKKKKKYILILIVTLITAQSTTGYISMIIIILGYLLSQGKVKFKSIGILLTLIVISGAMYYFDIVPDFIKVNFIDKLASVINSTGSTGTGGVRIQSLIIDLRIFNENILGAGYEKYTYLFNDYKQGINETGSAVALTSVLAIYGLPFSIYIYYNYFYAFCKIAKTKMELIVLILFFINTIIAQNFLLSPLFLVFIFKQSRECIQGL